ncbi:MAG: hypothetical protein ACR2PS_02145 [Pseudomonadales bacterium]
MTQAEHWADIKESTTVTGVRVMVNVYRFGGNLVFRAFLLPVIVFYFAVNTRARRASLIYLKRLHNFDNRLPAPRLIHSFKIFWQFGIALLDKFAVWMGRITRLHAQLHNDELIDTLQAQNKGAVILTSHLGNFEICRALSQSHRGVKLTVLVHTKNAERFNEILRDYDDQQAIELLQVSEMSVSTSIRLSEKIANGEFVAIAADRVPISSLATVSVDFLGHKARFPVGPFALASALGAPVIMLTCIKLQGRYNIFFDKLSDGGRLGRKARARQIEKLSASYVQRLQELVQLAPYQWFNFFDFWHDTSNVAEKG